MFLNALSMNICDVFMGKGYFTYTLQRLGTFHASAWRIQGDEIDLVGNNRIAVTETGAQVICLDTKIHSS